MDYPPAVAAILFPRLTLREADMRSEERRGRDGRERWCLRTAITGVALRQCLICHVVSTAQQWVTTRAKAQARTPIPIFIHLSGEHRSRSAGSDALRSPRATVAGGGDPLGRSRRPTGYITTLN